MTRERVKKFSEIVKPFSYFFRQFHFFSPDSATGERVHVVQKIRNFFWIAGFLSICSTLPAQKNCEELLDYASQIIGYKFELTTALGQLILSKGAQIEAKYENAKEGYIKQRGNEIGSYRATLEAIDQFKALSEESQHYFKILRFTSVFTTLKQKPCMETLTRINASFDVIRKAIPEIDIALRLFAGQYELFRTEKPLDIALILKSGDEIAYEYIMNREQVRDKREQTKDAIPAILPYIGPETREVEVTDSSGEVHVKGYYRKDGSYVHSYSRSKPRKK